MGRRYTLAHPAVRVQDAVHVRLAVLEPAHGDAAAGPPGGAPGAQAARPARLDVRARAVAGAAAARRGGRAGLDPEPRGPAADPVPDPRGVDGGAGGGPAVRAGADRPARGGDPLPHDLGHERLAAARGARRPEGLGVDRGDVVLRVLGLRRAPAGHRVLRVRLRDVRRLLGRAVRVREARRARAAGREHDHRGARADAGRARTRPSSARRRPTRCGWRRRRASSASTCRARRSSG